MDLLINALVVYKSFSQVTSPVFLNRSGWKSFRDKSSVKTLIIKSVSDPGLYLQKTEVLRLRKESPSEVSSLKNESCQSLLSLVRNKLQVIKCQVFEGQIQVKCFTYSQVSNP